ncbi:hypothetical protein UT300019_25420 [Clostridium sp. CTA-19]
MLVSSTPIVPSPSQEVIQSIDERPGNPKTGLITLLQKVPTNSNNPKFNNSGRNNPANKNTENRIGSKS